jgi:hypothetical protein
MHRRTYRLVGLRSWLLLFVLTAASPAFAANLSGASARVALVIGNSSYVNVPRLTNPTNDAHLMADTLRSLGFALVGGDAQVDLDDVAFKLALQTFRNQLQGADVGLFYYAGYAVQVRGANYLAPVGANPTKESDVDFQMLDSSLVLRQMEDAGTKLNLVILDACRNNAFAGLGTTDSGLAPMSAPKRTLISFSNQPNSVAQDGSDGNSPYTKALARAIKTPGLDIFRTLNQAGLAVASATGGLQQPWVSASPIKSDFYFAGNPAAELAQAEAHPADAHQVYTTRNFFGPHDIPPLNFAAYGIVAFPQKFTTETRRRHISICESYVATLPPASSSSVPPDNQMVTVWPIDNSSLAERLNHQGGFVCNEAVEHYDLSSGLIALKEAATQERKDLLGQGPYLLAWAPSSLKGRPGSLVLIADLSNATTAEHYREYFQKWRADIERNPKLWRNGWSQADLIIIIRDWADKWGTMILSIGHARQQK